MHIGLDLDEVVLNFIDPFLEFSNKKYGTGYKRENIDKYSFEACGAIPKSTNDSVIGEFAAKHGFLTLPAMWGAVEVIHALRYKGHCISYITHRPDNKLVHEDTIVSLLSKGLLKDGERVYFSGPGNPKSKIANELALDVFVDDSPNNVIDIFDNCPTTESILFTCIQDSIDKVGIKHSSKVTNWIDLYDILKMWSEVHYVRTGKY